MVEEYTYSPNINFFTRNGNIAKGSLTQMQFFGYDILVEPSAALSPEQVKCLAMAASGISAPKNCEITHRSRSTVASHLSHAYQRLEVSNICHATRRLFETQVFVTEKMENPPHIRLTPRDVEILDVVSHGKTMEAAGRVLFLSEHTVKGHLGNIAGRNNMVRVGNAGLVMAAFCCGELKPDNL